MKKSKQLSGIIGVVIAVTGYGFVMANAQTAPIVISDTTVFADEFETNPQNRWQVRVRGSSSGPTGIQQTVRHEGSGGNPGGFRAMTHSIDGNGSIFVTHIYTEQYYLPSEQGAIASLNHSEDRTSLDGRSVGSRVAVLQGGQVHIALLSTFRDQAWSTESVQGLTAQSFSPAPDFSASGDTIWFGYERANTNTNANAVRTNEHGIDNWRLEVFSSPAGAVACSLETQTFTVLIETETNLTITVEDDGQPIDGIVIDFTIISGPNVGKSSAGTTNAAGQTMFTYLGDGGLGTDKIEANGTFDGVDFSCTAQVKWVANRPPVARHDVFVINSLTVGDIFLPVLLNDSDPDSDPIVISSIIPRLHWANPTTGTFDNRGTYLLHIQSGWRNTSVDYAITDGELFDTTLVEIIIDCACVLECVSGVFSILNAATNDSFDLNLIRRFRDEVLQSTEVGSSYIDIYYNSTPEIAKILILDRPAIGSQAVRMVEMMQPALRNLLDGDGSEIFTQALLDTIGAFFDSLSAAGSDSLQQLIADELARVGPLDDFVGLAVRDVINIALGDSVATAIRENLQKGPVDFALRQNFPNPFNPRTTIRYSVARAQHISLVVYDVLGREVATLVDEHQDAGEYTVSFDGNGLASGVYFTRLQAGNKTLLRKMLIIR